MVYTGDLKSPARNGLVGSSPTSGTNDALVAKMVDALVKNEIPNGMKVRVLLRAPERDDVRIILE